MQTITQAKESYQKVGEVRKTVGIVGSRQLKFQYAVLVSAVTEYIVDSGYRVATGGAVGADQYVIECLLRNGACEHGTVFAPWVGYKGFPVKVRAMMRQFRDYEGSVIWGPARGNDEYNLVRLALLQRNKKLVDACYGVIAFLDGHARGTVYTIKKAAEHYMPLVVFNLDCHLPEIKHVKWVPLKCGGIWEGAVKAVYIR